MFGVMKAAGWCSLNNKKHCCSSVSPKWCVQSCLHHNLPRFKSFEKVDFSNYRKENEEEKIEFYLKIVPEDQRGKPH